MRSAAACVPPAAGLWQQQQQQLLHAGASKRRIWFNGSGVGWQSLVLVQLQLAYCWLSGSDTLATGGAAAGQLVSAFVAVLVVPDGQQQQQL